MRALAILLVACGDNQSQPIDAAIDAPVPLVDCDAPPMFDDFEAAPW